MSLEENKAVVRKFIEAYNKHDLSSIDDFIAPDFVDHTHHTGREGLKQLFSMAFKAFPDWNETIEDIIAEGDKVWVRITFTGTNTGEWLGFAPTGKKVTSKNVDTYRIVNGKLAEYWNVTDASDFNRQLGIIEYTEKGKKLFSKDVK